MDQICTSCYSGTRSHRRLIFRIMNSHRMYTLCTEYENNWRWTIFWVCDFTWNDPKERRKERKRKKAVGEKALKKKGRGEFTKRERKTREWDVRIKGRGRGNRKRVFLSHSLCLSLFLSFISLGVSLFLSPFLYLYVCPSLPLSISLLLYNHFINLRL